MKTFIRVTLILILVGWCGAEIPNIISYQGRLTHESTGEPVVGTHDITFRAFLTETSDTMLWEETHTVTLDSSAIYKVELGSITPFPPVMDFADQYWLEIIIDGTTTLSPRYSINPSPYSVRAKQANVAAMANIASRALFADSASTVRWANIADLPPGFADGIDDGPGTFTTDVSSPIEITGDTIRIRHRSITGNMISPMGAMDGEALVYDIADSAWTPGTIESGISGSGLLNSMPLWLSSDSLGSSNIFVDTSDNVGINTSSPDYKLTVYSTSGHNGVHIHASQPSLKFSNFYEDKWEFSHGAVGNRLTLYSFDASSYVMAIDSAGNVGIGYTDPENKLDVNGDISANGEIYKKEYSSPATPIAFGFVEDDLSYVNCTENVTVVWDSSGSYYRVTIEGEHYVFRNYVTVVTIASRAGDAVCARTNSVSGELLIYLLNDLGTLVQDDFHFVVYKL